MRLKIENDKCWERNGGCMLEIIRNSNLKLETNFSKFCKIAKMKINILPLKKKNLIF